jgi:hypothetical protein
VSCPYFHPETPRLDAGDPHTAMLPLGGFWSGVCRAVQEHAWRPDSLESERRCNLGYARGICARFPTSNGPDAIRFAITRDDGATLRIYYAAERDHHPFAHGPLEYSYAAASLTGDPGVGKLLRAQAEAYAASFVRRKFEASNAAAASR